MKLNDLQTHFLHAMHGDVVPELMAQITSNCAQERLEIYQHTIREGLVKVLRIRYPGIWVLVGNEPADNIARAFVACPQHLPKSGCLDFWEDTFPGFLKQFPDLREYPYLHDYALFEATQHRIRCANPLVTEHVVPETNSIKLNAECALRPGVQVFSSVYRIDAICGFVQDDLALPACVDEPCWAVMWLGDVRVNVVWVSHLCARFVRLIGEGKSMPAAVEALEASDCAPDVTPENLADALRLLHENELITTITKGENND